MYSPCLLAHAVHSCASIAICMGAQTVHECSGDRLVGSCACGLVSPTVVCGNLFLASIVPVSFKHAALGKHARVGYDPMPPRPLSWYQQELAFPPRPPLFPAGTAALGQTFGFPNGPSPIACQGEHTAARQGSCMGATFKKR